MKKIHAVNVLTGCENWRADVEFTNGDRKWVPILGGDKSVQGLTLATAMDNLILRDGEWGPYLLRKMEVRDSLK